MKKAVLAAVLLFGASAVFSACGAFEKAELATEATEAKESTDTSEESGETEASSEAPTEVTDPDDDTVMVLFPAENLDDTLKNSVNSFGWKLYEKNDKEKNLFYSPYSIESAIALSDLGAKGDTKSEIENVLGISDLESFGRQVKLYDSKFTSDSAKLTTANSIWIDNSLALSDEFEKTVREPAEAYFGGELKQADFNGNIEGVKKEISEWVKKNTNDMLSDYESIADESTKADIINAIYFYGEWMYKFDGSDTSKETFRGSKSNAEVDMMKQSNLALRYVENSDGVTAAALPYGNGEVEMDIFMSADESENIADVWDNSKSEGYFKALDDAESVNITNLKLPKFTMDETYDSLKEALSDIGMSTAFSDSADFSGIASDLKISNINHKAKIEVDEEGSRAAAVTEETMELTSMLEEGPETNFTVDRPFIFTIRDKENGVILFMGRVNNL